jgi:hypothetical protein
MESFPIQAFRVVSITMDADSALMRIQYGNRQFSAKAVLLMVWTRERVLKPFSLNENGLLRRLGRPWY